MYARCMTGLLGGWLMILACSGAAAPAEDYPYAPVPFTEVHFSDAFWAKRLETNRTVTLPYDFQKCEETGRISNFAKAGGLMDGDFEGIFFNDSDVYKIVEGAAYCLALYPDPKLDAYVDELIAKFAAAQEDDGYLYTARTLQEKTGKEVGGVGDARWSNMKNGHELYNVGHMYEAAVAHYLATGKRNFLDVALKNADLVASIFGPEGKAGVPGHEEIEIGLAKLYRVTGDPKYLDLAKFFLDMRGRADKRELYGADYQDYIPVVDMDEGVGHAVRAGYLYSGMADVAALTGEPAYVTAIDRIWDNVVSKKLYLTGGIGQQRHAESFADNYHLPNLTAYNETCAAIANCLWNHRLFLLHGDAKYMDVFERTLYNGFLVGISMEGNTFFYPNPLECDGVFAFNHGKTVREPWFGCSCCPANVVRFLPSLPGYVYAVRDQDLYVNLFVGGTAEVNVGGSPVGVAQETRYPWEGEVTLTLTPQQAAEFTLCVRIPGWAQGRPVPSDLYRYAESEVPPATLEVNGETAAFTPEKGYARLHRTWKPGDTVRLTLPMPVHRVFSHALVKENTGKVALEHGPIVFCAEGIDNQGNALNLILPDDAAITAEFAPDLLGGVMTLRSRAQACQRAEENGPVAVAGQDFLAIPYYAWAHRGANTMEVWFARTPEHARVAPAPTVASKSMPNASHVNGGDSLGALNDQAGSANSNDHSIPRFTWWDHRGTKEWVKYDFPEPAKISSVEVYWFDDTGEGQCRVPASWELRYHQDGRWQSVAHPNAFGVEKDAYNKVKFDPVTADALRIEVQLQKEYSGGILEWRVE